MTRRQSSKIGRMRRTSRRASATIELAIVSPILITLMLLAVDYGRFAHSLIAVTNATRAGAYYGASHPVGEKAAWDSQIAQAVADELATNAWFDPAKLSVTTPQHIDEGAGMRRVVVDVTYPFETFIDWPFMPGADEPIDMHRVVVMRGIR